MTGKLIAFIKNIEEYFLAATLGIMGIILVLQIFFRYVLKTPLIWSEEIVRFLFIWVTFIGASYTCKLKTFIKVEVFFNLFPPKVRKFISILNNAVAIAFFSILIPSAVSFMNGQSSILSTGSKISMSLVFAAVPVGLSLMVLRLLFETYELIINKQTNGPEVKNDGEKLITSNDAGR